MVIRGVNLVKQAIPVFFVADSMATSGSVGVPRTGEVCLIWVAECMDYNWILGVLPVYHWMCQVAFVHGVLSGVPFLVYLGCGVPMSVPSRLCAWCALWCALLQLLL